MTYITFDLETSVKSSYKRKANPFDKENIIVAIGYKRQHDKEVTGVYDKRGKHTKGWLAALLTDDIKFIIGHNIKFDIHHAVAKDEENYAAWQRYVSRGGLVWDTQLAEYLLCGMDQANHMLSLDETCVRYGGNTKIDEVKEMWKAGYDTPDIPENLLMEYLVGTKDNLGDIGNTEITFKGQFKKAKQAGQLKSIMLNMGSLCASIEMELNGMFIDMDVAMKEFEVLKEEVARLQAKLADYLPKDLPFEFKWTNRYHLSPLIFGGVVKYNARVLVTDENNNHIYPTKKVPAYHHTATDTWHSVGEQLYDPSEYSTYAGGKNKGSLKTKQIVVPDLSAKPKSRMEKLEYVFKGFTQGKEKWKTGDYESNGLYEVGAEIIKELGNRNIPFLQDLSVLTKKSKDLTTYYLSEDNNGNTTGMLTLVDETGLIHHSINHTQVVTGRLSSSQPNLQNIPRANEKDPTASRIKHAFRSRFDNGHIVSSDFKSLEIYIQALLTDDAGLLQDLRDGIDMHCMRLASSEHMTYDEVVKLVDSKDPVWSAKRTNAKQFSFKRAYGAGAASIAEANNMSMEEVEALIEADNKRYPQIEPWYSDVTDTLYLNRIPTKRWVAHPTIRGRSVQVGKATYRTPDNKLYTWFEYPNSVKAERYTGRASGFSTPEIKNYMVQGTGGEWAKAAMWLAVRAFYRMNNFNGQALLVNMVHDAQYVDAAPEVAEKAASLLHACMEDASTFMEWYFDWEVKVPVPSDTHGGVSMADESGDYERLHELVPKYKAVIRKLYIDNYQPKHGI